MRKKSLEDLKSKDLTELVKEAQAKKLEIAKADVEMRAGKEKNLKKVKNLRRDLAQILTFIREKEFTTVLENADMSSSGKRTSSKKNKKDVKITEESKNKEGKEEKR